MPPDSRHDNAASPRISIDRLIKIVEQGGTVRTGVDIVNQHGLLLEKDVLVSQVETLQRVKRQGVTQVPIVAAGRGGIWTGSGAEIALPAAAPGPVTSEQPATDLDRRLRQITEAREIATVKYEQAKKSIKQTLTAIQENDGEFNPAPVAEAVDELIDFISRNENSFSYLTREIFSYDDYLYNHAVNVCTIGTVIMKRFNDNFSAAVNAFLNNAPPDSFEKMENDEKSFSYFQPDELRDISIGFFMHDLGKVLIDSRVLNKAGRLTEDEFEVVKTHANEKALAILEKNRVNNPYIANVCFYHHARLYHEEPRCYPACNHTTVPPYVKVCKLADIYDAMTSKRVYREASNPVGVVTDIFNQYARKDPLLQYILHSFVTSVGIYPPGSVIALVDGRQCYVLESRGPTLLPITDFTGNTLQKKQEPITLTRGEAGPDLKIDRRHSPLAPLDSYKILPDYLRRMIKPISPEAG